MFYYLNEVLFEIKSPKFFYFSKIAQKHKKVVLNWLKLPKNGRFQPKLSLIFVQNIAHTTSKTYSYSMTHTEGMKP